MSRIRTTTHAVPSRSAQACDAAGAGGGAALAGKAYHFVGAGGVGMSGLAKLLLQNGATVAGSDMEDSTVAADLRRRGATIHIGHAAAHLRPDCDTVVISAAIKPLNPELQAAQAAGLEVVKYAQMLGRLMDRYEGIAVCGTHGKSTTSAWLAWVLQQVGVAPSFIIGADVPQLQGSSGVGRESGWFVAEACEYDRSFLNLHPRIGVILNIEADHLDYYADENEIVEAFTTFARGIRPDGVLIANGRDANVARVRRAMDGRRRIITFGPDGDFDYSARNLCLADGLYRFDAFEGPRRLGVVHLAVPGEHNVSNALAVLAAARACGCDAAAILPALGTFTGVDRRLMLKDRRAGITVMDDYAHHPTEIRASLQAIRERFAPRRLWCVFQPHQYSRTRFLLEDFADSFARADVTIVPEIYFVRDTVESRQRVNAEVLVERIGEHGSQAVFIPDFASIVAYLKAHVVAGDLVVTMGAGPVWKVADEYLQWLGENR